VQITDFVEAGGDKFYVMEHLRGSTLAAILAAEGELRGSRLELRPSAGAAVASPDGRPVLVAWLKPYATYVASLELPDSPPELRPEPASVEIRPAYRSVSVVVARAAAAISARGRLVDGRGEPQAGLTGDLLARDGTKLAFSGTFADEEGWFECYGLEAGAHEILWSDGERSSFTVPPARVGEMVELGDVKKLPAPAAGGLR